LCSELGTRVVLVVGDIAADVCSPVATVALLPTFGADAALRDTLRCVETAVTTMLAARRAPRNG